MNTSASEFRRKRKERLHPKGTITIEGMGGYWNWTYVYPSQDIFKKMEDVV